MTSAPSKLYADDVSLVVVLLDVNPFFWAAGAGSGNHPAAILPFAKFLDHVIPFLHSLLLMNQLNQVVLIATGINSCGYIYDSGNSGAEGSDKVSEVSSEIVRRLEEFVYKDRKNWKGNEKAMGSSVSSLLSGSLSLALCYIQKVFRSGAIHPHPRILCLQASPDGPEQYVAVMNAIFSAQRSMIRLCISCAEVKHKGYAITDVGIYSQIIWKQYSENNVLIDSCVVGVQHSAFLQQASYITGGIYLKPPQLDGLFQYLAAVFSTDLQSRNFLQLPKPAGVDFRASCFCHKKTIDMGYVCSVCLSIFCQHHKKCSTCGSEFNQVLVAPDSASDTTRKA